MVKILIRVNLSTINRLLLILVPTKEIELFKGQSCHSKQLSNALLCPFTTASHCNVAMYKTGGA